MSSWVVEPTKAIVAAVKGIPSAEADRRLISSEGIVRRALEANSD